MPAHEPHRILVIDDTPGIHEDFRKIFSAPETVPARLAADAVALFDTAPQPASPGTGLVVDSAFQGRDGVEMVRRALEQDRPYALAFVDMRMPPGWDGLETIKHLWQIDPRLQTVICTAHSDQSWHEIHAVLGPSDSLIILKKPFDHLEARQLAHALCRKWSLARENEIRLGQLDDLVRERTRELKLAEERFARAFDANPLPQAIQNLETGEILEVNDAHLRACGLTRGQILGATPRDFGHGLDPHRWQELINTLRQGGTVDEWPFTFIVPGHPPREFRCSARAVTIGGQLCAVWLFRDVTQQIQLEHQLRQSQKMEAVGQLAAGLAHDFNNLLTVILSFSSLALGDESLPEEHRTGLTQVCSAAQRAATLTRQLLVFSRRQIANPAPLDLAASLDTFRAMLKRLLPERITLAWHHGENLPLVFADAANIEQVVMNLVVNARDAIDDTGTIRLDLDAITFGPDDVLRHPHSRPGRFLRLAVADDGKGMDEEILNHAFEPFFTTKGVGLGTGLGLSTVYGIVQQHKGWIEATSVPGRGSTFSVYLPVLEEDRGPPAARTKSAAAEPPHGRGERILLVEDEPFVRDTTALVAGKAGYHITKADDGPGALRAWEAAATPFDLLITDMMMPNGINGAELALKLRVLNPRLKVIFSTGYSAELLRQGAHALAGARLLLKPYDSAKLLQVVRETLDAPV
ncbi:MAG TPA: response regulator [Opitutus sp.]|nr:response regulator [Opitutus sp.]